MPWQRDGFGSVTPYLVVEGADELLEFLEGAFDADVLDRRDRPDGTIAYAEVRVGDSMLMLEEASEDAEAIPGSLWLYVGDCEESFARALDAGGLIYMEPTPAHRPGERCAAITDPAGNLWWIATHVDASEVEAELRRIEELTAAAEPPEEPPED